MEKIQAEIIVNNKNGLHARPASIFVQIANKYDSTVTVEKDGEIIEGKSIIALLSLGVNKGSKLKLRVEGPDATLALTELRNFLETIND